MLASYKPGDAEKLGADYATLSADNPRLIYGHLTGYGPATNRAGYDAVLQAEAGFMHLNAAGPASAPENARGPGGFAGRAPTQRRPAHGAVPANRTGRGALVQVSLLDSALAALANQAAT